MKGRSSRPYIGPYIRYRRLTVDIRLARAWSGASDYVWLNYLTVIIRSNDDVDFSRDEKVWVCQLTVVNMRPMLVGDLERWKNRRYRTQEMRVHGNGAR